LTGITTVSVEGVGTFDGNKSVATFDDLPDVPLTQMAISLAGGNNGVFTAVKDLCSSTPVASATLTGKNGKISSLKVPISIEGCRPAAMTIGGASVPRKEGWAPITVSCKTEGTSCRGTLSLAGGALSSGK